MAKKTKTKKPTGLTITRNGDTFTVSWKVGDKNYSGSQNLQYILRVNGAWQKWTDLSITTATRSKSVSVSSSSYFPYNSKYLSGIQFRVRGKRSGSSYTVSDWSNVSMGFNAPRTPSLSSSLSNSNVLTVNWSITANSTDSYRFTRYEYQSILVNESNETNGAKLNWSTSNTGWKSGTGTALASYFTITEDTSVIASGSHTRWVRMRTTGTAGASAWAYTKHVYAIPYGANITNYSVIEKSSGYLADVIWNAPSNASHPIDETTAEYSIAIPQAGMILPSGASWEEAGKSKDTSGNDRAVFNIGSVLDDDECIFARVTTEYEGRYNYSNTPLIYKGKLATPSGLSVSVTNRTAVVQATNNSQACIYTGSDVSIKRLFLQIVYRGEKYNTEGIDIGIIPTGSSSVSITLPDLTDESEYSIGVRAVVGTYTSELRDDGTTRYTISADMISDIIWGEGAIPVAPENLNVEFTGSLVATWDWSWEKAAAVELSWSQNEDAWESTEEPNKYEIDHEVTRWIIKDIEVGKTYYVRARLKAGEVYSPYSETASVDLTLPPVTPVLKLSDGVIAETGKVTLSWNYVTRDGSEQVYAEVVSNNSVIAHTQTERYITLYAQDMNWTGDNSYDLSLRVKSASGSFSEFSDTVYVYIASPLSCEITETSLEDVDITVDEETRTVLSLTEMPLTVKVVGAGTGMTTVAIERAEAYHLDRPDESVTDGYEGETVFISSYLGEGTLQIDLDSVIGHLDDGAKYRIVAEVKDGLGQTAKDTIEFEVHWEHQAIEPLGEVSVQDVIAYITPIAPQGAEETDVCDIYRLSKDKPELIYPNGEFGTQYVDPYPAIDGGYRIVFKTANGDYITDDNAMAWLDLDSGFEYDNAIIDFGTDRVELYFNVDTSHEWSKDFKETKYLGGSVQGDWNPAISRSASITSITMNLEDENTVTALRRLAVYSGICNVRTLDGSSFHANVEVNESNPHDKYGLVSEFSLNITRVDPQGYDGMPADSWEE